MSRRDRKYDSPREFNRLERERKKAIAEGRLYDAERVKQPTAKAPKVEIPTFSECVIGYRKWYIDALGRLRPITVDQRPWVPGVNEGQCDADHSPFGAFAGAWLYGSSSRRRAPKKHKAPHRACHCGLYARFSLSETLGREANAAFPDLARLVVVPVVGAIAAWGDLQVHRDGLRASRACVVALAVEDAMPAKVKRLVERVAAEHRVACVPLDVLEMEASQHGTPLPDSAKPEPAPEPTFVSGSYIQYLSVPTLPPNLFTTTTNTATVTWGP